MSKPTINSLKQRLERKRKAQDTLWVECEEIEEQIAKMSCPFQVGQTIAFDRNYRRLRGAVVAIRYSDRFNWKLRVRCPRRVHAMDVYSTHNPVRVGT